MASIRFKMKIISLIFVVCLGASVANAKAAAPRNEEDVLALAEILKAEGVVYPTPVTQEDDYDEWEDEEDKDDWEEDDWPDLEECGGGRFGWNAEGRLVEFIYPVTKELDLSRLTALEFVNLSDGKLTNLRVSGLPNLVYLVCSKNQLTSLDLSNLPKLEGLDCSKNQLASLGLSNLPKLDSLDCSDNQLTDLDIHECKGIQFLNAKNNKLKQIMAQGFPREFYLDKGVSLFNYKTQNVSLIIIASSWRDADKRCLALSKKYKFTYRIVKKKKSEKIGKGSYKLSCELQINYKHNFKQNLDKTFQTLLNGEGVMLVRNKADVIREVRTRIGNYREMENLCIYQKAKKDFGKANERGEVRTLSIAYAYADLKYCYFEIISSDCVRVGVGFNNFPTPKQRRYVDKKAKALAKKLGRGSDYRRVKNAHDWICKNVSYDSSLEHFDAYSALKLKRVVCEGYAKLFLRIMQEMKIPCYYITGNDESHAWNIVKVKGKWYNVDLTWDSRGGKAVHDFFLKSDKAFRGHTRDKGSLPLNVKIAKTSYK